jgi:hypothetical protein
MKNFKTYSILSLLLISTHVFAIGKIQKIKPLCISYFDIVQQKCLYPINEFKWQSLPTIIKTGQFKSRDKQASCGTNYEICLGPASFTDPDVGKVSKMIKCYVPRNSTTCPSTISEKNGCVFLDANKKSKLEAQRGLRLAAQINEINTTSVLQCSSLVSPPACKKDGSTDYLETGCTCANFSFPRSNRTCVRSVSECLLKDPSHLGKVSCSNLSNEIAKKIEKEATIKEIRIHLKKFRRDIKNCKNFCKRSKNKDEKCTLEVVEILNM